MENRYHDEPHAGTPSKKEYRDAIAELEAFQQLVGTDLARRKTLRESTGHQPVERNGSPYEGRTI